MKDKSRNEAVKSLMKTYTNSITNLLHAFSALDQEKDELKTERHSIKSALNAGIDLELMEQVIDCLSNGVSTIVQSSEVAVRSAVVRDLRARFAYKEPPKKIDVGTQLTTRKPKAKEMCVQTEAHDEENQDPSQATASTLRRAASAGASNDPTTANNAALPHLPLPKISSGIYERQLAWKERSMAKLQAQKAALAQKEEDESAAVALRVNAKYAHIESVMRRERKEEESSKVAKAEKAALDEKERREHAEKVAAADAEARRQADAEAARARAGRELAEEKAELATSQVQKLMKLQQQLEEELKKRSKQHAEEIEIRDEFGPEGLERWPIFPGKRVWRARSVDDFDGRVSSEFRTKDTEGGMRGVSLLMGRMAATSDAEVKCVLFDETLVSELEAARWVRSNKHRFCDKPSSLVAKWREKQTMVSQKQTVREAEAQDKHKRGEETPGKERKRVVKTPTKTRTPSQVRGKREGPGDAGLEDDGPMSGVHTPMSGVGKMPAIIKPWVAVGASAAGLA